MSQSAPLSAKKIALVYSSLEAPQLQYLGALPHFSEVASYEEFARDTDDKLYISLLSDLDPKFFEFISKHNLVSRSVILSDHFTPEALTTLIDRGLTFFGSVAQAPFVIRAAVHKVESEKKKEDLIHTSRINLLKELNKIGIALSSEKDIDRLMQLILKETRSITCSDSGSIYLISHKNTKLYPEDSKLRDVAEGERILRFKTAQSDSLDIRLDEFPLLLDEHSIAGFVATHGQSLNIVDAYDLPSHLPVRHNDAFDRTMSYKTKSVLAIPMKNRAGEVIGIIQLINKKASQDLRISRDNVNELVTSFTRDDYKLVKEVAGTVAERIVRSYSDDDIEVASSIASQAAVALESAMLYKEIQVLFEKFIESISDAIDRKDAVTAGHSVRMANYALKIATEIHNSDDPAFKDVKFSKTDFKALQYGGLLHDVGKVAIPDKVMNKSNRLPVGREETIVAYLKLRDILGKIHKIRTQKTLSPGDLQDLSDYSAETKDLITAVAAWNRAGFVSDADRVKIENLFEKEYQELDGSKHRCLTPLDVTNLGIARGTLNKEERVEMESHMMHTIEILSNIPWPKELKSVPDLAGSHHEKIDGSGYPRGLKGDEILMGGKILAVVDIFEALTASDRPYKPPIPVDIALKIIQKEADNNKLDKNIVRIFMEKKVWEGILEQPRFPPSTAAQFENQ